MTKSEHVYLGHDIIRAGSLSRRELLRRAGHLGLSAPLAGALLAGRGVAGTVSVGAAAPTAPAETPRQGGNLVEGGSPPEPDTLDPHLTGYEITASLGTYLFDSLVRETGDYQYKPNLAERWDVSPDAKTYTFYLKKGVVFHDGTPFNAAAVRTSFDRIADPATQSKMAVQFLGPYDHTDVVDDSTIRVQFKRPYVDFLDGAARSLLGIISPAALQKYGKDIGRNPVGSGYFKFKEWVSNKHIKLERNDKYTWGSTAFTHTGPAFLDTYTLAILADPATALAAFDRGEVQTTNLNNNEVENYTGKSGVQILKRVYAGFPRSVFMNVDKPPTNDLRVRQACIYATNQEAIIKISLAGLASPAHGPLASTTPGYDKSVETMYTYDPDKAKQLLDEAGWKMGSGGIREKDGQKLVMKTIVNAGWDPYTVPLQAMMKAVGIDMQIQTLSSAARVEANAKGDGNFAPLGVDSSSPRVLDVTFHSHSITQGWAWSRYRSSELDALIDATASEVDQTKRTNDYHKIQQIIMQNALIIPMVENTYFHVLHDNFHGTAFDGQGFIVLHDAWLG